MVQCRLVERNGHLCSRHGLPHSMTIYHTICEKGLKSGQPYCEIENAIKEKEITLWDVTFVSQFHGLHRSVGS
jgi:hypothetical protein